MICDEFRFYIILPSLISEAKMFYKLKYNIVILHLPNYPSNILLAHIFTIAILCCALERKKKKPQIKWTYDN